jgi:hypothetical protein
MVKKPTKRKKPVKRKVVKKRIKRGSIKNMTNRQYIHGDYDGDGTPNIDDRRPFNKKKSRRVNPEVSLSNTIKFIEKKRRAAKKIAKPIAKRHKMKYRIKGTYSVINKRVRSNPRVSGDFIGLRGETMTRQQAISKWKKFNKTLKVKRSGQDNKYKTLKGSKNPYRALHSDFELEGYGTEAQFRTKKFGKLNDEMHIVHKNKGDTKKFLPRSKKLIKKGY